MLRTLILALCISLTGLACDSKTSPDHANAVKKDDEGNAWRGLLSGLDAAPTDDAKKRILERFIAQYPQHPDIAEAQRRLDAMSADPEAETKKLVNSTAQKAIEEGDPQALVALLASESVHQSGDRQRRDDLAKPVGVPTADGVVEVSKSLFVHPLVMRGYIRRTLMAFAGDKIDKRCDRECVNTALGGFLSGSIGGSLYLEDGKLNVDAVGPLLEKSWVDPDSDLLGLNARTWYAIFAPTFRAYVAVQRSIADADPAAGAAKLASLKEARETSEFYTSWAEGAKVAEETGLPASDARAIAGWWLRRTADGTAPLFEAQIAKVIEAYEPEMAEKK